MTNNSLRVLGNPATDSDRELFAHVEEKLYTAVVSDSLDELGYRNQVMREFIRPLSPGARFAGWARTIAFADVSHIPADPYGMEIEAVDSLLPGEVAVVSTGGSLQNAPWGELLSVAALARGARGAVVDGHVRDVEKIQKLGFPLFAKGIRPVDSKGRGMVIHYNVPVDCAGVITNPGDLVFADYDGVVVVPSTAVSEVMRMATEKADKENSSCRELMAGAYLADVYAKFGVL